MEILKGINISEAVEEGVKEIEERKLGIRSKGLKIGFPMLEECMGGGLQKSYAYLLPALSGHGKSTMLNIIETAVIEKNPEENVMVLNFNFETPSHMNLVKKFSADTEKTVDELLSVNQDLEDYALDRVKQKASKYKDYPIYYFDVSGTPKAISNTIMSAHLKYPEKHIVCFLDHSGLLTPSSGSQGDIELADEFAKMVIDTKKQAKCSWFILGQLNGQIETMERLKNPQFHAPKKGDLYGSKLTWNAMDVVVMMNKPEKLDLASYTTRELPTKDKLYFHIRKQRYGEEPTIMMDCSRIGQNILIEEEVIK